jgi:hypothetical protein
VRSAVNHSMTRTADSGATSQTPGGQSAEQYVLRPCLLRSFAGWQEKGSTHA